MIDTDSIAAIVLAAGYSARMGDFKPLLKLGGFTAIEHSVRCFLKAGIGDVRVVTGYRASEVAEAVKSLDVSLVYNPSFAGGMYSSVQAGIRSLGPRVRAFFILPADHPLIKTATVQKLLACFHSSGGQGIFYPVFNGRRGHPPLISTRYVDDILNGSNPDGLQGLLNRFEDRAVDVEVADDGVLLDMDTPEDYQTLLDCLNSRNIPSMFECFQILRENQADESVRSHCQMVAGLALALAFRLNLAGAGLDEDLVLAGALLHDVTRQQPEHPLTGASLLKKKGYPRVAEIVAGHMDIDVNEEEPISETEVVFLADKTVKGNSIINTSERCTAMLEKYKDDQDAYQAVIHRMKQADLIKKKANKILGFPVETIKPVNLHLS
jgi:putative nucleotidyltransferase with HDIG domain